MADSLLVGSCFTATTTAQSTGATSVTALTNIQINAYGANAPASTTLQIIDGSGAVVATLSLALPGALLTAFFGSVLSLTGLDIALTYSPNPVTVKLNNALSSGMLAVNLGFTF